MSTMEGVLHQLELTIALLSQVAEETAVLKSQMDTLKQVQDDHRKQEVFRIQNPTDTLITNGVRSAAPLLMSDWDNGQLRIVDGLLYSYATELRSARIEISLAGTNLTAAPDDKLGGVELKINSYDSDGGVLSRGVRYTNNMLVDGAPLTFSDLGILFPGGYVEIDVQPWGAAASTTFHASVVPSQVAITQSVPIDLGELNEVKAKSVATPQVMKKLTRYCRVCENVFYRVESDEKICNNCKLEGIKQYIGKGYVVVEEVKAKSDQLKAEATKPTV